MKKSPIYRFVAFLLIGSILFEPVRANGSILAVTDRHPVLVRMPQNKALFDSEALTLACLSAPFLMRWLADGHPVRHTWPALLDFFVMGAAIQVPKVPDTEEENPNRKRLALERILSHKVHNKWPAAVVIFGGARVREGDPTYQQGLDLGRILWENRMIPRTGAGPGMMAAVPQGYIAERDASNNSMTRKNATQGIPLLISQEPMSPWIERVSLYKGAIYRFYHFVTRKTGLHEHIVGAIAVPGGIGTIDELFEVWRRDRPLVLVGVEYYTPIMNAFEAAWEKAGLLDEIRTIRKRVLITDDLNQAVQFIKSDTSRGSKTHRSSNDKVRKGNQELEEGLKRLHRLPSAVTFLGKPHPDAPELDVATEIARRLIARGSTVRIASRGPLFRAIKMAADMTGTLKQLQGTLFVSSKEPPLSQEDKSIDPLVTGADSVHQVLLTKNADAFVVLPGGVGTMNKLFDILVMIQCEKLSRRRVIFVGKDYKGAYDEFVKQALRFNPPLISHHDAHLLHFVETADEAMALLEMDAEEYAKQYPFGQHSEPVLPRALFSVPPRLHTHTQDLTFLNSLKSAAKRNIRRNPNEKKMDWAGAVLDDALKILEHNPPLALYQYGVAVLQHRVILATAWLIFFAENAHQGSTDAPFEEFEDIRRKLIEDSLTHEWVHALLDGHIDPDAAHAVAQYLDDLGRKRGENHAEQWHRDAGTERLSAKAYAETIKNLSPAIRKQLAAVRHTRLKRDFKNASGFGPRQIHNLWAIDAPAQQLLAAVNILFNKLHKQDVPTIEPSHKSAYSSIARDMRRRLKVPHAKPLTPEEEYHRSLYRNFWDYLHGLGNIQAKCSVLAEIFISMIRGPSLDEDDVENDEDYDLAGKFTDYRESGLPPLGTKGFIPNQASTEKILAWLKHNEQVLEFIESLLPMFEKEISQERKMEFPHFSRYLGVVLPQEIEDWRHYKRGLLGDEPLRKQLVDVNQWVENQIGVARMNKARFGHLGKLEFLSATAADPLPPIIGIGTELRDVIMNLLANAADATPKDGRLTVTTQFDAKKQVWLIRVEDTGSGIAKENRHKIWEKMFSKKPEGKRGTGLGLPDVRRIVKAHNGRVKLLNSLTSEEWKSLGKKNLQERERRGARLVPGSTFEIQLPAARLPSVPQVRFETTAELLAMLTSIVQQQPDLVHVHIRNNPDRAEPIDLEITPNMVDHQMGLTSIGTLIGPDVQGRVDIQWGHNGFPAVVVNVYREPPNNEPPFVDPTLSGGIGSFLIAGLLGLSAASYADTGHGARIVMAEYGGSFLIPFVIGTVFLALLRKWVLAGHRHSSRAHLKSA